MNCLCIEHSSDNPYIRLNLELFKSFIQLAGSLPVNLIVFKSLDGSFRKAQYIDSAGLSEEQNTFYFSELPL